MLFFFPSIKNSATLLINILISNYLNLIFNHKSYYTQATYLNYDIVTVSYLMDAASVHAGINPVAFVHV